tara:strand:+ start:706 stop:1257 length:552 start_codon:yes stop_codon:yes gene_type:complete
MGYGKSKESASQEKKDLLGINPIANRASGGSFMSKHSIHSQGGGSPIHDHGPGGTHPEKSMTPDKSMTAKEFTESGVDKGGAMDLQNDNKNLPGGFGEFNRKNINIYADALKTGDSLQQVNSGKKYIEPGTTKKIYGQQGEFRDKSLTKIREIKNSRPETPESNTDYYNSLKSIFTKIHNKKS